MIALPNKYGQYKFHQDMISLAGDENAWHIYPEKLKESEMWTSDCQWFGLRWKTWHAGL